MFLSDLNAAEAAVKQYFDSRSPATQAWLKELSDLKSLDMRQVSTESLKASLAAVRAYQDTVRGTVAVRLDDVKTAPQEAPASAVTPSEKAETAASEAAAQPASAPAAPSEKAQEAKTQEAPKADKAGDKAAEKSSEKTAKPAEGGNKDAKPAAPKAAEPAKAKGGAA